MPTCDFEGRCAYPPTKFRAAVDVYRWFWRTRWMPTGNLEEPLWIDTSNFEEPWCKPTGYIKSPWGCPSRMRLWPAIPAPSLTRGNRQLSPLPVACGRVNDSKNTRVWGTLTKNDWCCEQQRLPLTPSPRSLFDSTAGSIDILPPWPTEL